MRKNHYIKEINRLKVYSETLKIVGYSIAMFATIAPFFALLVF